MLEKLYLRFVLFFWAVVLLLLLVGVGFLVGREAVLAVVFVFGFSWLVNTILEDQAKRK
jgi:small basic protein